jgi:cytochrome P450
MPGLVFTRYAAVTALLREPRLSNHFPVSYRRARALSDEEQRIHDRVLRFLSTGWMQAADDRVHAAVRRRLAPLFSESEIAAHEEHLSAAAECLAAAVSGQRVELMASFMRPLVQSAFASMFGLSPSVLADVGRSSAALARFLCTSDPSVDELRELDREIVALCDMLVPVVEHRRGAPAGDVISALGDPALAFSVEDVAIQCSLTITAGFETTAALLGNSMAAFLRHPITARAVRRDPALVPAAVEECLRYDSPGQWVPRVARVAMEQDGVALRERELVWLGLGAANRDPSQFRSPDTFDIARPRRAVVSFGGGAHHCLGAHLARVVARVALKTLLCNLESIAADQELEYVPNFGIRMPQAVVVRCGTYRPTY